MTPQVAPLISTQAGKGMHSAGPLRLETMKKRAEFLRAARSKRVVTPGFILQIRARGDDDDAVRVGYTCSKKVGNAVARNRAKRRLREVARLVLSTSGVAGTDYVLIGRADVTARRPFDQMQADLHTALGRAP